MIRHIIAAIATGLAVWAMVYMANLDKKAERFRQIQDVIAKSQVVVKVQQPVQTISEPTSEEASAARKAKEDETAKKLKALRDRAGNAMAFKVSTLYKQKCSSCHGVNGEGIIGPKLVGMSAQSVSQALNDFKSGKRKNYVMYGLLSKMDDNEIGALSEEIGTFQAKLEAMGK